MRKFLKLPHPIRRLASLLTCSLAVTLLISLGPTRLSSPVTQARIEPTLNLLSGACCLNRAKKGGQGRETKNCVEKDDRGFNL